MDAISSTTNTIERYKRGALPGRQCSRLFMRPLLDEECRRIRAAWERSPVPGIVDFEVNEKQVSFLTAPVKVKAAWDSLDQLLATSSLAKAS